MGNSDGCDVHVAYYVTQEALGIRQLSAAVPAEKHSTSNSGERQNVADNRARRRPVNVTDCVGVDYKPEVTGN